MRLLPSNGRVSGGHILLNGTDLARISDDEIRNFRWKEISIIFQGAMNALNPVRKIGDQIVEAILVHGGVSEDIARDRTKALLEMVEIDRRRAGDYPHEFSGGMRRGC
jgi:peptide/nickel transport system ATP-binding protein